MCCLSLPALAIVMTTDLGPVDEKYSKRIKRQSTRVIGLAFHKDRPQGAALTVFIEVAKTVCEELARARGV